MSVVSFSLSSVLIDWGNFGANDFSPSSDRASKAQPTEPGSAHLPVDSFKRCFISEMVRFVLSVAAVMMSAMPPGPYASMTSSSMVPPSDDFLIARSMLSPGTFPFFAWSIAARRRVFVSGLGSSFAAMAIAFSSFEKSLPRFWSVMAFLCFMEDHLL